mmetsp:Transcript_17255/g.26388  ORF Transcript_17255/g.26388 Transcript_17255/m.26388 type:complete len:104 (+) Transcript_17255:253-564(+)
MIFVEDATPFSLIPKDTECANQTTTRILQTTTAAPPIVGPNEKIYGFVRMGAGLEERCVNTMKAKNDAVGDFRTVLLVLVIMIANRPSTAAQACVAKVDIVET